MNPKQVTLVGAPLDLGASRRGVDMGPSAIRYADLTGRIASIGIEVEDSGNVATDMAEVLPFHDEHARYLPEILATCTQIARRVAEVSKAGRFPVVLGGDHSIAIGTLAGVHAAHGIGGVLWVDAHGDLNRPSTSPSGNVHGMPLATALGATGFELDGFEPAPWVDPSRVALVGIRSLDPGEKDLIRELGLAVFTMAEIDHRGIADVTREALEVVRGPGFCHLSLDVDACDPEIAPGVGTPVKGGLSYREAHLSMELVAEAGILTSLEVVEVNPILDHADVTGQLAVDLVASALGARIL
jgi:arginase